MGKIITSYELLGHEIEERECNERFIDIFIDGVKRGNIVISCEQSSINFATQCIEQDNVVSKLCGNL